MDEKGILASSTPVGIVCVRDRERARPFYRDILGLALVHEDDFAAVFEAGGMIIRVSVVPDFTPHQHTIMGFKVADITAVVTALSDKGVSFNRYPGFNQDELGIWTSPDKAARVAWFHDPDGNVLSVTQLA